MTDTGKLYAFPVQRYTRAAIGFHWLSALLVALAAAGGLLIDDIPKSWEGWWLNLHAATGICLLGVVGLRIWWRRGHKPPPLPAAVGQLGRKASHAGHIALYAALVIVPALGIAAYFSRGLGLDFGLFQIPALMEKTVAIARPAKEIHGLAAYALLALAGGHIAMALWHQFFAKDRLLARMMPAPAPAPAGISAKMAKRAGSTKPLP